MATAEKDHVYKILELVGSSETSIEDAIKNAVSRASKTIREMKWFEVVQTRGHIENGTVRHYQVTLGVGFTLAGCCGEGEARRGSVVKIRRSELIKMPITLYARVRPRAIITNVATSR